MGTEVLDKAAAVRSGISHLSPQDKGNSAFILCPYHSEKTPSGRVWYRSGRFQCYGCGQQSTWEELKEKLGIEGGTSNISHKATKIKFDSPDIENTEEFSLSDLPRDKVWRDIPTNFLIEIGARLATDYDKWVYLPVYAFGKLRGHIKARTRKSQDKNKPSYLNKQGSWSKTHGLFPFDYVAKMQSTVAVLVEGPRDALRLCMYGIPALCILGTQSFSTNKVKLLRNMGVTTIILCMDGDTAGIQAVETLTPFLSDFDLHVFDLAGKDSPYDYVRHDEDPAMSAKEQGLGLWDPGNMPVAKVKQLRRLTNQLKEPNDT